MTRINCIDPAHLSPQHLLAEYRELPRVFGLVKRGIEEGRFTHPPLDLPQWYCLGAGHVTFFYDKLWYLVRRQKRILDVMSPSFNIQHTRPWELLNGIPDCWINDWTPLQSDKELNLSRLVERDPDFYRSHHAG